MENKTDDHVCTYVGMEYNRRQITKFDRRTIVNADAVTEPQNKENK